MKEQASEFHAVVVGAGATGLSAAVLLAQGGVNVALIAPRLSSLETRTVALMQPAMRLLEYIGIWPGALAHAAQPLRKLTLVDDTGSLLAAPRLTFSAEELGLEAFGWNIPLERLCASLQESAERRALPLVEGVVERLAVSPGRAILSLSGGKEIGAKVVLAADGRNSIIRRDCHIASREWSYDQAAIAGHFAHSADHHDTSTEYLSLGGPLTTVPLPGRASSLVWMGRSSAVSDLMALPDEPFMRELQAAMHGELGLISSLGPRLSFPMRGLMAAEFGAKRAMLMGEAAHLMPPIGAQGLNVNLRDAATAAELVVDALKSGADPGSRQVIRSYDRARRSDVFLRQAAVHNFDRSLLADFLPLTLARTALLALVGEAGPLRRLVMRQGLGSSGALPRAMRPLG